MSGLDLKLLFKDAAETTRKEQAVLSVSSAGRERCVSALSVSVSPLSLAVSKPLWIWAKNLSGSSERLQQHSNVTARQPAALCSGSRLNGQKLAAIPAPKRWSITWPLHRRGCQHFMVKHAALNWAANPCVFVIKGCRMAQTYKLNIFYTSAF